MNSCSLMVEVIMFSHRLVQWLSEALKDLPSLLGMRKVQGTFCTLSFQSHVQCNLHLECAKRIMTFTVTFARDT